MMLPSLRTILVWASYSGSYLSTQSSPTQAERLTRAGSSRHCYQEAFSFSEYPWPAARAGGTTEGFRGVERMPLTGQAAGTRSLR